MPRHATLSSTWQPSEIDLHGVKILGCRPIGLPVLFDWISVCDVLGVSRPRRRKRFFIEHGWVEEADFWLEWKVFGTVERDTDKQRAFLTALTVIAFASEHGTSEAATTLVTGWLQQVSTCPVVV